MEISQYYGKKHQHEKEAESQKSKNAQYCLWKLSCSALQQLQMKSNESNLKINSIATHLKKKILRIERIAAAFCMKLHL